MMISAFSKLISHHYLPWLAANSSDQLSRVSKKLINQLQMPTFAIITLVCICLCYWDLSISMARQIRWYMASFNDCWSNCVYFPVACVTPQIIFILNTHASVVFSQPTPQSIINKNTTGNSNFKPRIAPPQSNQSPQ